MAAELVTLLLGWAGTDPSHRLYIQIVWIKDIVTEGSLLRGAWDHKRNGSIVHLRREDTDQYPRLDHRDVYEIITTDEEHHPLPSIRFFELRYAAQKLGYTSNLR